MPSKWLRVRAGELVYVVRLPHAGLPHGLGGALGVASTPTPAGPDPVAFEAWWWGGEQSRTKNLLS